LTRYDAVRAVIVAAALAVAPVSESAAQSYPVKECDSPPPALGILHGIGQVSYLIDAKGHPDTASIRVVSSDSISLGGFRSAAARELVTCTFVVPKRTGKGSQSVFQQISFGGKKVFMSVAMATTALESDFTPPKPRLPAEPLEVLDPRLEERPRQLGCDRAPNYPPIFGTPSSVQAANAARADWEQRYSGRVVFRFVIGVDGRPETGSIIVVSSTNPALTNIERGVIPSCRFAPGRIGGFPVRTFMTVDRGGIVPSGPGL
jgi:hypothetical protein